MKPYRSVALFCALLCLFGCGASRQARTIAQIAQTAAMPFCCSGTLTLPEIEQPLLLSVDKRADGLVLTVTDPEPLGGLRLEFDEELTHLHYRELTMQLLPGDIPEQSVLLQLRDVFAALPLPADEAEFGRELVTLSGRAGMTPYTTVWNEDGTALTSVFLPNCGATFAISDFVHEP